MLAAVFCFRRIRRYLLPRRVTSPFIYAATCRFVLLIVVDTQALMLIRATLLTAMLLRLHTRGDSCQRFAMPQAALPRR